MRTIRKMQGRLHTAATMRALEASAIASGRVDGAGLMEAAGAGVVAAILRSWPALETGAGPGGPAALVLCGPGNNGGDGFVVARLLAGRGWRVELRLLGSAADLRGDAATMAARWHGPVLPLADGPIDALPDLVVDALFGTGLTRPFTALPVLCAQIRDLVAGPASGPRVVAVDVPSGLSADSGTVPGGPEAPPMAAHLTVGFHAPKLGQVLAQGPAACGTLVVVDIGLGPDEAEAPAAPALARVSERLDKRGGHKFDHGHALVLAGPPAAGGAARMAARAALRVGAGLVTLACPEAALPENAARLDAVMLRGLGADEARGLAALLDDRRITALCLGPGLGIERAARLLGPALGAGRALVLDADALSALAGDPALAARLGPRMVLTPHGGEFARLCPDLGRDLAQGRLSRAEAAQAAAARLGATLLLKGPDTVIAAPDGRLRVAAAVYEAAVPWLATAGAGDVLAGLIAGLLARGLAPLEAAETAALLHAEAARGIGPGLIAEDLPDALPRALSCLLNGQGNACESG